MVFISLKPKTWNKQKNQTGTWIFEKIININNL